MENQDILGLLDERIAEIAKAVLQEVIGEPALSVPSQDDDAVKLRAQLALIKAKEHITVREAALLMSCSDSHIRKMVMLARKRKAARPIPFVELESMAVFPVQELLAWAKPQTRLQVVKNEAA